MHDAVLSWVEAHLPDQRESKKFLEFGSRNINGSVRQVVGSCARFVGIDLYDGPDVDIVGDAGHVVIGDRFDCVVCTEVFEHADDAACTAMIVNAFMHLKAGGRFIATMAGPGRGQHSAVDGGHLRPDEFYRNVDHSLLESWLLGAGFAEFEIDQLGTDIRCVAVKGGA